MSLSATIARGVIALSSWTPLKGVGGYGATDDQLQSDDASVRYAQAFAERSGVGNFYRYFDHLPERLKGRRVVDFGCAYGGKTAAYAEHATFVAGVDPFDHVIGLAQKFAASQDLRRVEYRVCTQSNIPYPDAAFDVVVSHDVIEHVDNPEVSLREIARVLKPGGQAYIVFPPYDGMFSHHLDYVSRAPGLHWLFSAQTLIAAVNRIISSRDVGVCKQPDPRLSWRGDRFVLPQLNGLRGPEFTELANRYFASASIRYDLIGRYHRSRLLGAARRLLFQPAAKLGAGMRDRLTWSIAAVLTK